MSRPSTYSEPIATAILAAMMEGKSLRQVCDGKNMPNRATVYRWMEADADFAAKCAHARLVQADVLADEMADIEDRTLAGDVDAAVARVVLSSKQWRASKMSPKKYGDRLEIDGNTTVTHLFETDQAVRMAQALARKK
jgi:hypothetical protein